MVLIWLIKRVFYKIFLLQIFFVIYKNERECWFSLLSKKPRRKAKDYYKNNKETLRGQARDKYRNLSQEEKNKKREYGKNRYHNMSEGKKQRLKEYQKNYRDSKILNISSVFCCYLRHTTNIIINRIVF